MSAVQHRFIVGSTSVELPNGNIEDAYDTGDAGGTYDEMPNGGALDSLGGETAYAGVLEVSPRGILSAATPAEIQTKIDALSALVGKTGKLYRRNARGDMQWRDARLKRVYAPVRPENITWYQVTTTWELFGRCWNGDRHGAGWFFDSGVVFDTGYVFDQPSGDIFSVSTSPSGLVTTNNGTRIVTNVTVTITAGANNISNIALTCGGVSVIFTGTVLATKSLVLNCGSWEVFNNGASAYANLTEPTTQLEWLRLAIGANNVTVSWTGGGTISVTFDYSDAWN